MSYKKKLLLCFSIFLFACSTTQKAPNVTTEILPSETLVSEISTNTQMETTTEQASTADESKNIKTKQTKEKASETTQNATQKSEKITEKTEIATEKAEITSSETATTTNATTEATQTVTASIVAKDLDNNIRIKQKSYELNEGDSVFTLLQQACTDQNISLDYQGKAKTAYIKGIDNLYEKDHGAASGWTYTVNGKSPSVVSGEYILKEGDTVVWQFVK